jgi:hypothetical protein
MNVRTVYIILAVMFSGVLLNSCFKDIPQKKIVFNEDFSKGNQRIRVYGHTGLLDSPKLFNFNGTVVFGRFNNNRLELDLDSLPQHNLLRFQFDLYIHDQWEGDHLDAGTGIPDVWKMQLDYYPWYLTTFSNTANTQSFPGNYPAGNTAFANAWAKLPGACSWADRQDGTTLYKIDFMTGHSASKIHIDWSDALQPFNQPCQKSWSMNNIVITASTY